LQDSINHINRELGLLKCRTEALSLEKNLLFKDESIGGVSKGVAVTEIEKASTFFNKRYVELNTELFNLNEKANFLLTDLDMYKNQINELSVNTSKAGSEIIVTVNSPSALTVAFTFKFLTPKAGWAPVYDCKYQGTNSPLTFIFRANIFNATGIAWENVDLKLSTANPTDGFNTPSLNPQTVTKSKATEIEGIKIKEVQVANAIAEYSIKHKYSVPSDAKPYLIDVNTFSMPSNFYYLVIPKLDPLGFLMAKTPNWNKYNLIPGTTNIYNKGSYMGKIELNTYPENDTLSLYLGKDNSVQATIKETNSSNKRNIIGNYYIDKSAINITVKNNTSDVLNIQLLDQVPVFADKEKVKFNIENIEQAIYNNKEGLLTWSFQLTPAAIKAIDYNYEIKIPKTDVGNYRVPIRKYSPVSCPSF
jgi:hypothetical protein